MLEACLVFSYRPPGKPTYGISKTMIILKICLWSLIKKAGLDKSSPANYLFVKDLGTCGPQTGYVLFVDIKFISAISVSIWISTFNGDSSCKSIFWYCLYTDGNIAILALLDLKAAFDTVDHQILLQRLQRSFGIDETALRWFEWYVIGRTQYVHLSNNTTPRRPLVCGASHGSVLWPLLFVLYTAGIGSIIAAHGLLHHCYTDDTQIYFFCRPSNLASVKDRILSCIDDITEWLQVNRLRLNPSETEFDTSRRNHCISAESFTLVDGEVKPVNRIRNLGAFFDSDMNMRSHVNRLASSCYYQMRRIRSIRRSIPTSMAITLMNSFIIARVDYCNSLLAGLPVYKTDRIQTVLNDAARLVFGRSQWDHVTPVLRDRLHWLCAPQFRVALLVYKAINNLAPDYITVYCQSSSTNNCRSTLRSADKAILIELKTRT